MTIRQFDVVANPLPGARGQRPYLVSVQHHRLDLLKTRIAAPLLIGDVLDIETRLKPSFEIEGNWVHLDPTDLVTLSVVRFASPIANLESERDRIIAALDLVFTGI